MYRKQQKSILFQLIEVIYGLDEFKEYNFKKSEIARAAKKAQEEYNRYRQDIEKKGEETLKYLEENNIKGIVLSGRPYHIDGEINHGIDTMIKLLEPLGYTLAVVPINEKN